MTMDIQTHRDWDPTHVGHVAELLAMDVPATLGIVEVRDVGAGVGTSILQPLLLIVDAWVSSAAAGV